jgi:hypothetical protein
MGNGAGRLLGERGVLGVFPPRSRPQSRVPMGRGRPAGVVRSRRSRVLRPRPLERPRSNLERAAVRPDGTRRQSRRRRQGMLLLPRRAADPRLRQGPLQVPPGRVSLRAPGGGESPAHADGPRVRAGGHRRVRRGTLLRRVRRIREGSPKRHPDTDHHCEPRARDRHASPAAVHLVPQYLVVGADRRRVSHAATATRSPRHRHHPRRSPHPGHGLPRRGACRGMRAAHESLL